MNPLYLDQIEVWIIQAFVFFLLLITLFKILMREWKSLRHSLSSADGRKPAKAPPSPKTRKLRADLGQGRTSGPSSGQDSPCPASKKRPTTERTEATEQSALAFLCELRGLSGESLSSKHLLHDFASQLRNGGLPQTRNRKPSKSPFAGRG